MFLRQLVWAITITLFSAAAASGQTTIKGIVADANSSQPIIAASIQLMKGDSLVQGLVSAGDGSFAFRPVVLGQGFYVEISVLGYTSVIESLPESAGAVYTLGPILLKSEASELQRVVVTGTRPILQMDIDKKVFNAERAITAKGGTAIDVLRNVPSISVDADGGVTMRNNSPQIFVDGRPTVLSLDQIAADDIETVEIITNPGSRYDASAAGGIINIVLKKNKRRGLNGAASVGAGVPNLYTGNISLNLRQGPLNFFISSNFNQSGGIAESRSNRTSLANGAIRDQFSQQTETERLRRFHSTRMGVDWFMDKRNVLSVSQSFNGGRFGWNEQQHQQFFDASGNLTRTGERPSNGIFLFDRTSTQVNYKRTFDKKGREFTTDITYNTADGRGAGDIVNTFFGLNGLPVAPPTRITDNSFNNSWQLTVQADYINPLGENGKIEAGLRTFINDFTSQFNTFSVAPDGQETKLPLSNHINYQEQVHAGYINYANKVNKWSYQGGLRLELSSFDGLLIDSAQSFGYRFPDGWNDLLNGLFPSAFITYEVSEKQQVQFNYSRRVRRPNFWHLNPFVDISDPLNIRQGNLNIRPENTHAFELNFNQTYPKGSYLAVLYFQNNLNDITMFSDTISAEKLQQLNNAAIDPSAILNTFVNADYTNRLGAEFTLMHKVNNQFEITPTVNLQYRKVQARINGLDLGNEGINWEGKLTLTYKTPATAVPFWRNWGFQLMGEYESPRVIPQGRTLSMYGADLAIRKDFLKENKASVVLAVNDIFDTRRRGVLFDTPHFVQDAFRRWNVRTIRLTLNYRFGRNDFQLFQRRNQGGEPGGGMGGGGFEG